MKSLVTVLLKMHYLYLITFYLQKRHYFNPIRTCYVYFNNFNMLLKNKCTTLENRFLKLKLLWVQFQWEFFFKIITIFNIIKFCSKFYMLHILIVLSISNNSSNGNKNISKKSTAKRCFMVVNRFWVLLLSIKKWKTWIRQEKNTCKKKGGNI